MPTNEVSRRYLGRAGVEYASAHHGAGNELGYRLNAARFLPHLQARDTLLDFGCGNGGMTRILKAHVARSDALEVNPAARAVARQNSGCTVYGDLREIPMQPIYDVIVSNHVLEHVRDVCGTLEALRERLKPEGRLVVMLPIDDFRSSYQRQWVRQDNDHHLHTWTPRLFANTLHESGFEARSVKIVTSAWHPGFYGLMRRGLTGPVCWAAAVLLRRRQLLAIAVRPA